MPRTGLKFLFFIVLAGCSSTPRDPAADSQSSANKSVKSWSLTRAFLSFCESFLSRSELAPTTPAQMTALTKLGYSKTSVERLSKLRPDLVNKILSNPEAAKPVNVFRGLTVTRENYDPKFMGQKSRRLTYRGFGNANAAWVARELRSVVDFASVNQKANGIIVGYEIPAFMLLDDSKPPKILAEGAMIGQLSREDIAGDESPFVHEIIELNGKKISVLEAMAWASANNLPPEESYKYFIKTVLPVAEALPLSLP